MGGYHKGVNGGAFRLSKLCFIVESFRVANKIIVEYQLL